jgi:hypothetical protein
MFIEVNPREFEKINQLKYPELFPDGAVYEKPDRLYRHNKCYVGLREMAGIVYADILNLGEPENLLPEMKELIKRKINVFEQVGFYFPAEYKSKTLVKRIIKGYEVVHDSEFNGFRTIIIKEVQNVGSIKRT